MQFGNAQVSTQEQVMHLLYAALIQVDYDKIYEDKGKVTQ